MSQPQCSLCGEVAVPFVLTHVGAGAGESGPLRWVAMVVPEFVETTWRVYCRKDAEALARVRNARCERRRHAA